jgi:EpsI family protein
VWLWVGYFRQQRSDRKLVSSTNTLVADTDKRWVQAARATRKVELPSGQVVVRTAELRQAASLHGAPSERLLAWQLYWVGERLVSSDAWAKIYQAFARMRGRGDDGAALILVTPLTADSDATLEAFLQSRATEITAMLAAAGGSR